MLGVLYLFFGAFPLVFETNHGFSLSQSGMSFLGLFVGMVIGILSDVLWRRNYARLQARAKTEETQPEWRLPPTVFGAWMLVVGLFGFAWTSFKDVSFVSFRTPECDVAISVGKRRHFCSFTRALLTMLHKFQVHWIGKFKGIASSLARADENPKFP